MQVTLKGAGRTDLVVDWKRGDAFRKGEVSRVTLIAGRSPQIVSQRYAWLDVPGELRVWPKISVRGPHFLGVEAEVESRDLDLFFNEDPVNKSDLGDDLECPSQGWTAWAKGHREGTLRLGGVTELPVMIPDRYASALDGTGPQKVEVRVLEGYGPYSLREDGHNLMFGPAESSEYDKYTRHARLIPPMPEQMGNDFVCKGGDVLTLGLNYKRQRNTR